MSMCIFDGHDLGELFTVGNPEVRFLSSNVVSEHVPGRDGAVITGRTWGTGECGNNQVHFVDVARWMLGCE